MYKSNILVLSFLLLVIFCIECSYSKVYSQDQLETEELFVSADGEPEPPKLLPGETIIDPKIGPNWTPGDPPILHTGFSVRCSEINLGQVVYGRICCLEKLEMHEYKGLKFFPPQDLKYGWFAADCCPVAYYLDPKDIEKIPFQSIYNFDDSCSLQRGKGQCKICAGGLCKYPQPKTETEVLQSTGYAGNPPDYTELHVDLTEASIWPEQKNYIETFYKDPPNPRQKLDLGNGERKDGPILCLSPKNDPKIHDCKENGSTKPYADLATLHCYENCYYGQRIDKLNHPGCTYNFTSFPDRFKTFWPTEQIEKNGLKLLCSRPGHIDASNCDDLAAKLNEPLTLEGAIPVKCAPVEVKEGDMCVPENQDLKKLRVELGNYICCECTGGTAK